jgi:hypothetical protein
MFNSTRQIAITAVLGLAVCALTGAEVRGQNRLRQTGQGMTLPSSQSHLALTAPLQQALLASTLGLNPYAGIGNLAGLGSAYAGGVNPYAALSSNPYGAAGQGAGLYGANSSTGQYSSPYGNPYSSQYPDPNGAYLQGGASVINAQSRFVVSEQLAYQIREQVRGEQVANRRKIFDEYLYEREKSPSAEEERQKAQRDQLNRSRNNPPVTEIWSGKALNDLLADLRQVAASGESANGRTLPLPLDDGGLNHINVTKDVGGSIALLKNDGRFDWPAALNVRESERLRGELTVWAQAAIREAEFNGRVDKGLLQQMGSDVKGLQQQLRLKANNLSPSEYIEANNFLHHFDEALHALGQPDVGNYFTGKYALKAETVAQLVQQMVDKGLQFAPALPGDESAYSALHQALATYDRAAQPQITAR